MTAPLLPHHDGSPLHVSNQAPSLGEKVTLRLRVPTGYPPLRQVTVRSNPDHEPHWDHARLVGTAQGWDWWQAEITVTTPNHGYRWMLVHETDDEAPAGSQPRVGWVNQAGTHRQEVLDAYDFRLLAHPAPPDWLCESVMYQIFPDRFARSAAADQRSLPDWAQPADWTDPVDPVMPARVRQFYGGDLDGITERLDHLESLGVRILYLTPFFPAASNHRYDASSFMRVDPLLGGEQALIRLVEAAHDRGMKVIGDLTTNHSGDRHEWFQRALADPESPERSFYYFNEDGSYESWLGTATLPKFNWASQQLREAFIEGPDSVVAHWLKSPFNLDGWRIDVANMTGRLGEVDLNAEVRQILRRTMEQVKPDSILLAESTNDATSDLTGDAWHGAMTYPSFTRPLWSWLSASSGEPYLDAQGEKETVPWFFGQPAGGIPQGSAEKFAAAVDRFNSPIPWRVRLGNMHPLNTHDTARFVQNAAPGTVPVAVGLQMTLPGLPTLFAGDEFGLSGADGESSRTPIPWDSAQQPETVRRLSLYRELIALRRQHQVLRTGSMRWLHADEQAVVFLRDSTEETMLVLAAAPAEGQQWRAELPSALLGGGVSQAARLFGDAELSFGADSLTLGTQGPCFAVWQLPGVVVP
ncbi:glycoside hydrolase family 13 protein [Nesterenkonia alkaliphila]|uniref:Glycoside hydrolase family 13 protein n=1 Tax=Nesterenkonia alkaliphila TaxID=1463631 RepID=A0A7K1ULM8_9MICC|nr:glycoside hydrolase family 13 protein [Nesterenkonia alkaliphila]MVT27373.1 glycoside hydrolase family 13 protein [Nesterenkonia alkaliphila]GFZ80519.1 alpha-glycosidase [Nesterenkonia alkaliphila]